MKYIVSAGGTGGHIYPAIAIINKIKEKDKEAEFLYIGTTDRMEKDIIPDLGIEYIGLKIKGLSNNPIKLLNAIYANASGVLKCKKIMKDFKPNIVIGVGGYITVPVIYAARSLGIPTLLHEQNSYPGKANTFLSRYTDTICVSMKDSLEHFKNCNVVYTGNPRAEEAIKSSIITKKSLGLSAKSKLVLITTGSLGASTVNDVIKTALKQLRGKPYEVLFVTGKSNYNNYIDIKEKNIKVVPYLDNMTSVLKLTDLVVSRAGATTIAEITALGIPSILIPSPYVANNHQFLNALYLKEHGATILIEEKDLNNKILINSIDKVLGDDVLYNKLKSEALKLGVSDSASRIYEEIKKLLK